MPHAKDAEAESADRLFGALDGPELFVGDLGVIRNARREARRRRLVPRRQPGAARQLANLGLREIHFVERAADAELARGLTSGPIVAAIVGVVAVDDDRVTDRGDARQMRVELVLAVVAAVRRIRAILGAIELARADDFVVKTEIARDPDRELAVALRIAGAVGGDGDGALAQGQLRRLGDDRAVDAAAKGDGDLAEVAQDGQQAVALGE